MTLRRFVLLAFLPAVLALLPFAPPQPTVLAAADAPITIAVTLEAGPLAAARTWRFEVVDASGGLADTVELSLSGDASFVQGSSRPLPPGAYTVRQLFGNDMATACGDGVFYANANPERVVQLDESGATVSFTITVCPDAPGEVVVDRPDDGVTSTPTEVVDVVAGTRVAGDGTPGAPATGTGLASGSGSVGPQTSLLAALSVFLFIAPLAITAIRRE